MCIYNPYFSQEVMNGKEVVHFSQEVMNGKEVVCTANTVTKNSLSNAAAAKGENFTIILFTSIFTWKEVVREKIIVKGEYQANPEWERL